MKTLRLLTLSLLTLSLVAACGGGNAPDPDKDPLDNAEGMGNNCEQNCAQFEKEVKKFNEDMIRDAGCEVGPAPGEIQDGQATGTIDGGSEYFCPNRAATDAFAEATANKSQKHKDALNRWKENCPCWVRLYPCTMCAGVPPGGLCPTEFYTKEDCVAKGGVPQDGE